MRARAGVEKGVRFGRPVVVVVNHDERSRQLQLHRGSKRGQESQEEGREGGEEKRGGIIQAAASVQSELGLQ